MRDIWRKGLTKLGMKLPFLSPSRCQSRATCCPTLARTSPYLPPEVRGQESECRRDSLLLVVVSAEVGESVELQGGLGKEVCTQREEAVPDGGGKGCVVQSILH